MSPSANDPSHLTFRAVQASTVCHDARRRNRIENLLLVAIVPEDEKVQGGVAREEAEGGLSEGEVSLSRAGGGRGGAESGVIKGAVREAFAGDGEGLEELTQVIPGAQAEGLVEDHEVCEVQLGRLGDALPTEPPWRHGHELPPIAGATRPAALPVWIEGMEVSAEAVSVFL